MSKDNDKDQNEIKDPKKVTSSRRKVVKAGLIGGTVAASQAAPTKWTKPVVSSVLLPAHAAATGGGGDGGEGNVTTYFRDITSLIFAETNLSNPSVVVENQAHGERDGNVVSRMADILIPESVAQSVLEPVPVPAPPPRPIPRGVTFSLCVIHDAGQVEITFIEKRMGSFTYIWTASGSLDSNIGLNPPFCPNVDFINRSIRISNPTDSSIDAQFTGGIKLFPGVISVPVGNCVPDTVVCPQILTTLIPVEPTPP